MRMAEWRQGLALLCVACGIGTAASAAAPSPSEPYRPAYHTCAAYFFLAARGHEAKRYDALYSAGEFALNQSILEHGREEAELRMGSESGVMMTEIERDWRLVDRLDRKYGGACEALLRDAHFEAP